MKFSIITVTKNNKAGLIRAIDCVLNQTYKNIEHIVVDGGSTDGSVQILRFVQNDHQSSANYSLITIIEPDSGIYDAINKGIKLATGDVVGLLHSDDLYSDEDVISRYADIFIKHNVDAVYSDLVYVKEKSRAESQRSNESRQTTNYQLLTANYSIIRYWKTQKEEFKTEVERNSAINHGWMPPHPSLFIKKEILDNYGLYRTDMKIAADYEMILRLFYKHKITSHYLPKTTYMMELGGVSNKSMGNIIRKSKEDFHALKISGINFPILTLISKNFRKLPQFLARDLS